MTRLTVGEAIWMRQLAHMLRYQEHLILTDLWRNESGQAAALNKTHLGLIEELKNSETQS